MFEFFDHTADLGIRVQTARLEDIYAEAAQALFCVIVEEPESVRASESRRYMIPGDDRALLLFDWLRALLLAFETEGWLVRRCDVHIGDEGLTTTAWGEPYDPDRHPLSHEVKAITYHGLRVDRKGNGWIAEVIVDIEVEMNKPVFSGPLEQVDANCWRIPKSYKPGMRVDGLIFASETLMAHIRKDQAPEQVANVACLPGIQMASLAMPDIHWGYGFCIGGVCATDPDEDGIISPGGVGYDINCGVRLVRTNLTFRNVKPRIRELVETLFKNVPSGVGKSGKYKFDAKELRRLMGEGTSYVVGRGLGTAGDLDRTEANGRIAGADPDAVSDHAVQRGASQCGTLGSGNHFMEVQVVDDVFDEKVAAVYGLAKDQICVMIHSGSRGLGYQVCDDALASLRNVTAKYGIDLPDRQLTCAPVNSPEGKKYIDAMRAAANFGFCNRQLLMHQARETFAEVFGEPWEDLQMSLLYDVAHNIAKLEEHTISGKKKRVWVHRKGATRAFPAGHPEVPDEYRAVGQPVIIPGDMGRASWVLCGMPGSMERTFGTTCHGAGRAMSRTAAVKEAGSRRIDKELESRGVIARSQTRRGLAEEQPKAYKNVDDVVDVVHDAGLSRKVARMRPIGVIKG